MLLARVLLGLSLCGGGARAEEIKLATWSLGWLTARPAGDPALPPDVSPKRPEDVERLRSYADALDADVIALQQVDGPEIAARVFPPDRYRIVMTRDRLALGVGFAIRRGIGVTVNPDLAALDVRADATFRLRSGADVTIDGPGGKLRLLAVHLKAGCREDPLEGSRRPQCATLAAQLAVLQGWIAQREAEGAAFAIAGDFNRWMDGSDPFLAALQASGTLSRATEGRSNPCWSGGPFTDHILSGGPARGWMEPETMRVLTYAERGPEWRRRLSDHCPLSIRLRLPDGPEGH